MKKKQTPLMRQYKQIKSRYPDTILFFRLGDFFETFEDDAVVTARVCGITLTKRNNGEAGDVPLAGFPYHQLDNYLPKMVRAGYRVAVCEQIEDPKQARGIVRRDVVEVVTPGTTLSDKLLTAKANNYCVALFGGKQREQSVGIAYCDISTGELAAGEIAAPLLADVLQLLSPSEVLLLKDEKSHFEPIISRLHAKPLLTRLDEWIFAEQFAQDLLTGTFKTASLKGFGIQNLTQGLTAIGAVLHYVKEARQGTLPYLRPPALFNPTDYMLLDQATKRNLEILYTIGDDDRDISLFSVVDKTLTAMGGRLLKRWLSQPLTSVAPISERLEVVAALHTDSAPLNALKESFRHIGDIERLVSKATSMRLMPREAASLAASLHHLPTVKHTFAQIQSPLAQHIANSIDEAKDLLKYLDAALADEPPATVGTGNVFRQGFSAELDEYRDAKRNSNVWIEQYRDKLRAETGISSLKVSFNNVFGYYIEITNIHKNKVPDSFSRKQTLANAERYITPELKAMEEKVLHAEEKISEIEKRLFAELIEQVATAAPRLLETAAAIAVGDCLYGFAELALAENYARPAVNDSSVLEIIDGRHPVVEKRLPIGEVFVPNSTLLSADEEQVHILTGPNMAGKSCYLRQTALIVLLAQCGSFVPAKSATIGIVDRIFTRVGAQDNINAGESTFLVEMQEAANILNNATKKSLILLDEVGRGTATFDGIAIAWSLAEHLHDDIGARTLFATHYHELTELASRFPKIKNYVVEVKEINNTILFTRKVIRGSADHSFGIHVARMAGLPAAVTLRADEIMKTLEENAAIELGKKDAPEDRRHSPRSAKTPSGSISHRQQGTPRDQLTLFELRDDALREELRHLDVNSLTPIAALQALAALKEKAMAG